MPDAFEPTLSAAAVPTVVRKQSFPGDELYCMTSVWVLLPVLWIALAASSSGVRERCTITLPSKLALNCPGAEESAVAVMIMGVSGERDIRACTQRGCVWVLVYLERPDL
jgi:hypothetical protein